MGMGRTSRPAYGAPEDIIEASKLSWRQLKHLENYQTKPVHHAASAAVPLAIVAGIVTEIKSKNVTLVQSQRARTWVVWQDWKLPPGVKIGARITAWGKLITFGNARSFQIVNSVMLERISGKRIVAALAKILEPYIVAVEESANGHDQS
jgi:hypothetical protein